MPLKPSQLTSEFMQPPTLNGMAINSHATVLGLIEPSGQGPESTIVQRLAELGFLPGESIRVLRRGPGGREPIAVQVGDSVFALRGLEASCVVVAAGT